MLEAVYSPALYECWKSWKFVVERSGKKRFYLYVHGGQVRGLKTTVTGEYAQLRKERSENVTELRMRPSA